MNIGLPGTGIGGLFYLLLASLMPAHALWTTACKRAGPSGWRTATRPSAIASMIVFALWVESWGLHKALACRVAREWLRSGAAQNAYAHVASGQASIVAVASAATLAAVLIAVHGAGCWLALCGKKSGSQ